MDIFFLIFTLVKWKNPQQILNVGYVSFPDQHFGRHYFVLLFAFLFFFISNHRVSLTFIPILYVKPLIDSYEGLVLRYKYKISFVSKCEMSEKLGKSKRKVWIFANIFKPSHNSLNSPLLFFESKIKGKREEEEDDVQ